MVGRVTLQRSDRYVIIKRRNVRKSFAVDLDVDILAERRRAGRHKPWRQLHHLERRQLDHQSDAAQRQRQLHVRRSEHRQPTTQWTCPAHSLRFVITSLQWNLQLLRDGDTTAIPRDCATVRIPCVVWEYDAGWRCCLLSYRFRFFRGELSVCF